MNPAISNKIEFRTLFTSLTVDFVACRHAHDFENQLARTWISAAKTKYVNTASPAANVQLVLPHRMKYWIRTDTNQPQFIIYRKFARFPKIDQQFRIFFRKNLKIALPTTAPSLTAKTALSSEFSISRLADHKTYRAN